MKEEKLKRKLIDLVCDPETTCEVFEEEYDNFFHKVSFNTCKEFWADIGKLKKNKDKDKHEQRLAVKEVVFLAEELVELLEKEDNKKINQRIAGILKKNMDLFTRFDCENIRFLVVKLCVDLLGVFAVTEDQICYSAVMWDIIGKTITHPDYAGFYTVETQELIFERVKKTVDKKGKFSRIQETKGNNSQYVYIVKFCDELLGRYNEKEIRNTRKRVNARMRA